MNVKQGIEQLKQDIIDWYKGILAVAMYILVLQVVFGNVCTLVITTGLPCPGCGITRACISLLTFQWGDAWNYNCVIFLIVPFALYWFACRYLFQCKCRGFVVGLTVIALCLLGLYIYRMIHYYPGNPPMVYNPNNILYFIWKWIRQMK